MDDLFVDDLVSFRNSICIFSHYTEGGFCVVNRISEDGTSSPIELHHSLLKKIGRLPMNGRGKLTTIVGPMSSGKTLELIRKLSINEVQGKSTFVAKHKMDTRDLKNPDKVNKVTVQSRLGLEYEAFSIPNSTFLLELITKNYVELECVPDVIGIEEGQFWDKELIDVINKFLIRGIDVIVTGLNQNFKGMPFGVMPSLMALSDDIILLKGVCSICKQPATKTQRLIDDEPATMDSPEILVGAEEGKERYECRCVDCWVKPV
jgi:thymidine kinase